MPERQELQKTLKIQWVWAIAFGSSIGWGAFVLPTDWLSQAGPLGTIIGLSLGAILMIMIGVSYGALIKKYPVSGGEFTFAYIGLGRTNAFVCGWFLTLGYMSIVALNASALALLVKFLFPDFITLTHLYNIAGWDVYLWEVVISTAAIITFAYLNIKGSGISGNIQYIFSMILIISVIILGIATFNSDLASLDNMKPLFPENKSSWLAILSILAIAPWAYVGFDNIPQAAEEFKFDAKKSFSIIVISLIASCAVYVLMVGVTSWTFSWVNTVNAQVIWGTGEVINNAVGKVGVFILAIAVLMGVLTGLNGFYMSSSRLLFAMSRAKVLPEVFSKVHPVYKTPYVGVIFTCLLILAAPWFGRQALLWVVDMSSTGVSIAYFYTCFAAYRLFSWKVGSVKSGKEYAPVKKTFALFGCFSSIIFLLLLLWPTSPAFLQLPSRIALIVWVVLGAVFYLLRQKEFNSIPKNELDHLILGESNNQRILK